MKIMQPADTLLYFDPSYKTALKDFTKEIRHLKKSVAKKQQTLVFFCIGSDRATGDCLGPLVRSEEHTSELRHKVQSRMPSSA